MAVDLTARELYVKLKSASMKLNPTQFHPAVTVAGEMNLLQST